MGVATQSAINCNTSYFSTKSMNDLIDNMYIRHYDKNSKLYLEGDRSNSLFFIFNGKVKLTKLNEDGKELTMYNYFEGDLFGEYTSMNNHFNSFTAQIVENSKIGVIQQYAVENLLREDAKLATEFTLWMSQTHRYTQMKLRDLLLYGKNGALASTLIRISNTYGKTLGNKIIITRKFTNIELAKLIGATRETVNRLLTTFKDIGYINYDYGKIEILNLDNLKEIHQCENCPVEICRL